MEENEQKAKFGFGQILKDRISGFTGAVMGISYYATGCIHYGLAPLELDKDGKVKTWEYLDETRLEDTGKIRDVGPRTINKQQSTESRGGPVDHPECK